MKLYVCIGRLQNDLECFVFTGDIIAYLALGESLYNGNLENFKQIIEAIGGKVDPTKLLHALRCFELAYKAGSISREGIRMVFVFPLVKLMNLQNKFSTYERRPGAQITFHEHMLEALIECHAMVIQNMLDDLELAKRKVLVQLMLEAEMLEVKF